MTTTPKSRAARPRADADRFVDVHVTLPAPLYDKAYAAARDTRQTVPAWIRAAVQTAADRPAPPAKRSSLPADR